MRKEFAKELAKKMEKDQCVWLLVGDLGYEIFADIRERFPDRFLNCGVSEQAMIGIAVGLANSGKIPFVYSITPFLLYRPYEFIRNLINYDKANVKLVASGREDDYGDHNYTHLSLEEKEILKTLPNIKAYWPESPEEFPGLIEEALKGEGPFYINIKRK